jgi:hypothetical protein
MANLSDTYIPNRHSPINRLREQRSLKDEASALFKLRIVWGLRLCVDILIVLFSIYSIMNPTEIAEDYEVFDFVFILIFFSIEIIFILAFFRKKRWSKIPLNIFSAISLLSFPIGTYFSIIHYFNISKIKFNN